MLVRIQLLFGNYHNYSGTYYASLGYTVPTVYFAIFTISLPCYFITNTNTIVHIINSRAAMKKHASFNAVVFNTSLSLLLPSLLFFK